MSIVEVLIAILLVGIAAVAVAKVAFGSSHVQSSAKLSAQQYSAAEAVMERLSSDHTWARRPECDRSHEVARPCQLADMFAGDRLLYLDGLEQRMGLSVLAQGVDNAGDLTGQADRDGLVPDYFVVTITVTPPAGLPRARPVVLSGVINSAGRADAGSLMVRTCGVSPQHDERIPVAVCLSVDQMPIVPDASAESAEAAAFGAAQRELGPDSANMTVFPVSVRFVLRGVDRVNDGVSFSGQTSSSSGTFQVKGLTPGRYSVEFSPVPGYERWASHSIPAVGYATVEPARDSHVLQVFRPTPQRFPVRFEVTDCATGTVTPGPRSDMTLGLTRGAPLGRFNPADGPTVEVAAGSGSVFVPARPGLYVATLKPGGRDDAGEPDGDVPAEASGGNDLELDDAPFIWIDPQGTHQPASALIRQVIPCPPPPEPPPSPDDQDDPNIEPSPGPGEPAPPPPPAGPPPPPRPEPPPHSNGNPGGGGGL